MPMGIKGIYMQKSNNKLYTMINIFNTIISETWFKPKQLEIILVLILYSSDIFSYPDSSF